MTEAYRDNTQIDWAEIGPHIPTDPTGRRAFLTGVYGAANYWRERRGMQLIPLPNELTDPPAPETQAPLPPPAPTEQ